MNKKVLSSVVAQVVEATKPKNRLATLIGFLLGGIVPLAIYVLAHYEMDSSLPTYLQWNSLLILGGLAYSAKTVYDWGVKAFGLPVKALGFVILLEGVMVTSSIMWLTILTLVYLIAINGIATGCTLALQAPKEEEKK